MKINISLSYFVGGAYIGMQRIASALPRYQWVFSKKPQKNADIVVYMNDHNHYLAAKKLGIEHIIQRKTGIRSLSVCEPESLDAVICASKQSFQNSEHKNKILIYNGIDLEHLKTIIPKSNIDLLICESRLGKGQRVNKSINYALKHNRHLTILGNGDGIANDNTYKNIKKQYPQFSYPGRVSPGEALSYIKGCNGIIIANPSHGCANQAIEAQQLGKQIIDLTGKLEIPPIEKTDLRYTAKQYDKLFKSIISGS